MERRTDIFYWWGGVPRKPLSRSWERAGGADKQPAAKLSGPQFKGPLGPHTDPAQQAPEERPVELAQESSPYQHMAWRELRAHAQTQPLSCAGGELLLTIQFRGFVG